VSTEFNRKFASLPARDILPSETPSAPSEREAPPRTQLAQARVGARVRVHGLQNNSEFNNSRGTVMRAFDGGRFWVLLDGEGGQNLALKPENFSDAPGNLPSHPDFNAENLQTSLGASPYGPLVTGMRFVVFFVQQFGAHSHAAGFTQEVLWSFHSRMHHPWESRETQSCTCSL
jgi:hypothetical protein